MNIQLTSGDYWRGASLAALASLLLAAPLVLIYRPEAFRRAALATGIASALFWGPVAVLSIVGFWEIYYKYIYPPWARWAAPLDILLYAAIGLGMWWLATRFPGPAILWFLLLGGCESLLEHLFGIYALHILEKVPVLQGVAPAPALVFAFFEYIVYWAIVGWLALALLKILELKSILS